MIRNLFNFNFRIVVTIVALIFIFGLEGYGQTIDNVQINEAPPFCAGSTVNISFTLTDGNGNGNGKEKNFVPGTTIIITLSEATSGTNELANFTLTQDDIPDDNVTGIYTLSTEVIIPADLQYSLQYQIVVESQNPSPQGNKAGLSAEVEIYPLITNNLISEVQSGCNPYNSQPVTGSQPTGGNDTYTYLWETSTAGPTDGFSPAPGSNSTQDYNPGILTQTTWFRRVVTSGVCTSESNVIEINITNNNTWTGDINNDWNTPGNWSCNAVPIPASNVIVPSFLPSTNFPVLNTGVPGTANDITIEEGASITINNNVLKIGGVISNTGSLDAENGNLTFVGSSAQTLPADCLLNNRLTNLTVQNSAGLTLNGPVEVTGIVLAETGDLISNGNLRLISNATKTAIIAGSGTGEVLGNVSMQRFLNVAYGYKYFSTPFQNSTVGDFSPYMDLKDPVTNFPQFYGYDESRQSGGVDVSGWVIDTTKTNNLEIGRGYAINFGKNSTSKLVELSGEVNNGQIDLNLQNNQGLYTQGFHLLGNPYPSPIDWTLVARNNMEDAIYFYTASATDQYTGVYSAVVGGVSSDGKSSTVIPSMQGFFVKVAEAATTGSISFQNSTRISDFSQEFLKKPGPPKKEYPIIRLQAGFKSNPKDPLVIYFPPKAKVEFEADKDAQKLFNTDPNVPSFYSILENDQKLSINGTTFSEEPIPLGIAAERSGEMTISLQKTQNLTSGSIFYLLDVVTGKMINLLEKQSHTFKIKQGEHNDRFFLVLSTEKLSAAEMDLAVEPFSVYSNKGEIIVRLNLPENELKEVKLINISGQLLQKKTGKGKDEIRFEGVTAPGIFMVNLEIDGNRITKKILLKN